ncbi:MAG: ammonium transporter [Candidatus Ancillula sp.]|jgi:Amt family ammonium transporter|nr:ammonium transporter [Candidatus Ancillula sp.]
MDNVVDILAATGPSIQDAYQAGNGAWMLTAASLVFLMTPAVAFFYGGMVRSKSVLNMLMLSTGALIVVAIIWPLWGWSIAYGTEDIAGIFANPFEQFMLNGMIQTENGVFTSIPTDGAAYAGTIDVAFQVTFAMITVALISGAIAERVKFSTWLIFVTIWITFVYCPMAHMVWGGGLLSGAENSLAAVLFGGTGTGSEWTPNVSPHDFAGGTVVHINAGIAALVVILIIGKRVGFGKSVPRPHNMPFVMLGAFLLWFGWFGFNAGSAFASNGTAGYAWVSTTAATGASALAWVITERIRDGKFTSLGAASGIVAGLVAITPAADVVSPGYAILLGAIAGVLCCLAIGLKFKFKYDDSLDVIGVHFVGGLVGTLLIGFFAAGTGLFESGSPNQLIIQLLIAAVAIIYSGVLTSIIAFILDRTMGWRVTEEQEVAGIDFADHGETAYDYVASSGLIK